LSLWQRSISPAVVALRISTISEAADVNRLSVTYTAEKIPNFNEWSLAGPKKPKFGGLGFRAGVELKRTVSGNRSHNNKTG